MNTCITLSYVKFVKEFDIHLIYNIILENKYHMLDEDNSINNCGYHVVATFLTHENYMRLKCFVFENLMAHLF